MTIIKGSLVAALAGLAVALVPAQSSAVEQPKLESAGWVCIQPLPVTEQAHCIRPHRLTAMFEGRARTTTFLVYDLDGNYLGTEVNLRGDIYRKGTPPCPTDPPTYEYTHLLEAFGLDYYACHRFDSDHL
jgi:hypothetical protein